ncbi:predicted protein [Naegleria gruberi]|uniref:Predicted protein n=1 Tax=Naegleria gruberi TaxID=5762 RepID=D2UXQ9_NAEGR|nr:uncharacterized protein NAEGRDRAFT_61210 [Naegleria gruberi]EFC50331.1 predicted protein [Naegleria gruberi]|eukprot:XP_002683075.1 predicted protein [Naegleria gruberi strain NEG-M]
MRNVIQTPTFSITEIISDSEEEAEKEDFIKQKQLEEERISQLLEDSKKKRKRKTNDEENSKKKSKLPSLNIMDNFDEEVKPGQVKISKPFDYEALKQSEQSRGVVYISTDFPKNQCPPTLKDDRSLKRMLSEFGEVSRVESKYEKRGLKKFRIGYFAEFADKNTAKKVAITLNGSPVSRSDSRVYNVKFMPNFEWSEVGEDEELQKMKRKLLKAEVQKELKTIKEFKKNKKWSESIKQNKTSQPQSNFRFNQKGFIRHEHTDTTHIDTLNIFTSKDSQEKKLQSNNK